MVKITNQLHIGCWFFPFNPLKIFGQIGLLVHLIHGIIRSHMWMISDDYPITKCNAHPKGDAFPLISSMSIQVIFSKEIYIYIYIFGCFFFCCGDFGFFFPHFPACFFASPLFCFSACPCFFAFLLLCFPTCLLLFFCAFLLFCFSLRKTIYIYLSG